MDFTSPSPEPKFPLNQNNIFEQVRPETPNQQPTYSGIPEPPTLPQGDYFGEKPKKGKRLIIFGAIFVALGLLIAGGVFAYYRGYISLPFLAPKINEVLAKTFEELSGLKTARYVVDFQLVSEDREEGLKPLDLSFLKNSTNTNNNVDLGESYNALFNAIPIDFDLQFQLSGIYNKEKIADKRSDNEVSLNGHYASMGSTYALDLQTKIIDEIYYFRIDKFPAIIFFDPSPYAGKWVAVSKEAEAYPTISSFGQTTKKSTNFKEQIRKTVELALKHKIIILKPTLKKETIDGHQTNQVEVTFDRTNFKNFYQELTDTLKAEYGDDAIFKYSEETVKKFDQTEFQNYLDYFQENSLLTFWVDRGMGIVRKVSLESKYAPPEEVAKFKDKQIKVAITFTLKDINETVNIVKPSDSVTWDEVERERLGITEGEQKIQKQHKRVNQLKFALRDYNNVFKEYPQSLEELLAAKDNEVVKGASFDSDIFSIGSDNIQYHATLLKEALEKVNTTDVFIEKEYPYQRKDKGYEFTYQITFADVSEEKRELPPYNNFIEGTNTANESNDLSLEKETSTDKLIIDPFAELKKKDTDADGLNDYLEIYTYRTSISKKDSDDDGFDDKTEIDSGYNPNGAGKL